MKYKTIYGLKFYGKIYDLDTQQHFKVTNGKWYGRCGWFLLKSVDSTNWMILKYCPSSEYREKERYTALPQFTRIGLYNFLSNNFGSYKGVQSILDSLFV